MDGQRTLSHQLALKKLKAVSGRAARQQGHRTGAPGRNLVKAASILEGEPLFLWLASKPLPSLIGSLDLPRFLPHLSVGSFGYQGDELFMKLQVFSAESS